LSNTSISFHFFGFWSLFFDEAADLISKRRVLDVLFPFLEPENEVRLQEADLVICSVFADLKPLENLKKNKGSKVCIIQWTAEARIFDPQHRIVDLTIGSDSEGPQDVICPLALIYNRIIKSTMTELPTRPVEQRKFAIMVGRETPQRKTIYGALCRYRQVEGFGKMFGNTALGHYWSPDYIDLLSRYKFVICFENEMRYAYHTEKIINPLLAASVPVYWGSSSVSKMFAPERFLTLESEKEVPRLVQQIRDIDENDEQFNLILSKNPWTLGSWESTDATYGCQHAIDRMTRFLGLKWKTENGR